MKRKVNLPCKPFDALSKAIAQAKREKLENAFLLQLRGMPNLPNWQREWHFDPIRKWRFDFCWPGKMIAFEIEGGQWSQGRHTRGAGFEADCEKYNAATIAGWRVFRITPAMIRTGTAMLLVERVMRMPK